MVQGMRVILEAMESLEIRLEDAGNECHVHTIFMDQTEADYTVLPRGVCNALKTLWADKGIQEAYGRRREY